MSRHLHKISNQGSHRKHSPSKHGARRLLLCAAIAMALVPGSALAQKATKWQGDEGRNWFTPGNWAGGKVPTKKVVISNKKPGGKGPLINGKDASLTGKLTIGPGGQHGGSPGLLTVQSGGTLTVGGRLDLAHGVESTGVLTMTGSGTTINVDSTSTISKYGDSTVKIANGAVFTTKGLAVAVSNGFIRVGTEDDGDPIYERIGDPSKADITIAGNGSRLNVTGNDAVLGRQGRGTLTLRNGGTFSVGGGTGTLNAGMITVSQAKGVINIGGTQSSDAAAPGFLDVGLLKFGNGPYRAGEGHQGGGVLVFNHTDNNYVFSPELQGYALVKVRSGTTKLTADSSSFLGPVSITGGANLIVSGKLQTKPRRPRFTSLKIANGTLTIANGGKILAKGNKPVELANGSGVGVLNLGAAEGKKAAAVGDLDTKKLRFGDGNGTLVFNHTSDYVFDVALQGKGKLRHLAGTTTLTRDNSAFSGTTSILGGTVLVNNTAGSGTGSSAVNVSSGATLGGTGNIGGAVDIANATLLGEQGETLKMDSLRLHDNARVDVSLGASGNVKALFDIQGNLTLDGTLNITDAGGFGPGVYKLMTYGGTLTDNGLDIGSKPSNAGPGDLSVQTSVANQVNLISNAGQSLYFWDGDDSAKWGNNKVDGGGGTWVIGSDTWTVADGSYNSDMTTPGFAVFQGTGGTVTVDNSAGNAAVTGMQFMKSGYVLDGSAIDLVNTDIGNVFRVGDGAGGGAGYVATINTKLTGNGGLRKLEAGKLVLTEANGYKGGTSIEGGTLQVASDASLGNSNGSVTIDNGTLRIGGGGFSSDRKIVLTSAKAKVHTNGFDDVVLGGAITGEGSLNKQGAGTLRLTNGNNDYASTVVRGGTLIGTAATISGDIDNNATIVFDQTNDATFEGAVTGKNSGSMVKQGGGVLTLAGQNKVDWTIEAGGLVTEATQFAANTAIAKNATLTFRQDVDGTYGGVLSGTGSFAKRGKGSVELTGDSSAFAGHTTLNGGGLAVSGKLGGDINVMSGGRLSGAGAIGGKVDIRNGGILVGQSDSTLTMGSLVLGGSSLVEAHLGVPSDTALFKVKGDLELNGTLNIVDDGGFGPGVYRLMDYTGTLTDNTMEIGEIPDGVFAGSLSIVTGTAQQVNLESKDGLDTYYWDGGDDTKWNNGNVNGGDGTWTGNRAAWADGNGIYNTAMTTPGFAIFMAKPGTVTVDNANGAAVVDGMQFAADGYQIKGGKIKIDNTDAILRVGDGSKAGKDYTATIAADITATGNVDKTDRGTLELTGSNQWAGNLRVEGGTLAIRNGGTVSNQNGYVGFSADSTGSVIVDGSDSAWANGMGVRVGESGHGSLTITNGGGVSDLNGTIAVQDGSVGSVTVGGAGSRWINAATLVVGGSGRATLDISNGGKVVAGTADMGRMNTATSAVAVSGEASILNIKNNAHLGGSGNASLTIAEAGTVKVGGTLFVTTGKESSGTVNIGAAAGDKAAAAGTLVAGTLEFGKGDGRVVFNHTDDGYVFDTQLVSLTAADTNRGALEQLSGTTILTANNKGFLGNTTVKGGILLVNNKNGTGTGTGAVNVKSGGTLGGTGRIAGAVDVGGGILQGQQGQTLTMGSLMLHKASQVNVTLDAPGNSQGLFDIQGDLTLDGTLNIANGGDFGPGVYRLMDYSGKLTDNTLEIGATPSVLTGDLAVQISVAQQVNLAVGEPADLQFWDGAAGSADNGRIDGGSGTWTATSPNWTGVDGERNGVMDPSPGFAIFQGQSGTITTDASDGALVVTGMQFASDGYVVEGDAIELTETNSILRVGDGTSAGAGITATVDADLNGAGVRKTDRGTLVLTGANSWSGDTSVEGGTLHLAKGGSADTGAVAVGFNPTESGVLAITGADTTWSADSAQIGFGGDGTLQLSDGGTFSVGDLSVAEFDSGTGRVIIGAAAGKTATAAGHLDAKTLTFGAGAGTLVFNHTDTDYTFGTALAGNGQVQQLAGTTHLSADSSAFTGMTAVDGGSLWVDQALGGTVQVATGATLGGNGTVGDLDNAGTVAPGASIGTLTVDGDYIHRDGATLLAEIDPDGRSDLLDVTGTATIEGGDVQLIKAPGRYTGDTRYTLIDADGGVDGTFDALNQDAPFLDLALAYDAHHVFLDVARSEVAFCEVAATRNQCATGQGAESTGAGNPVYAAVAALPDADTARAAFDELSGESYASTRAALLQDSRFVREAMNRRLHRADTVRDDSAAIGGTAGAFWTHVWGHWGSADSDGNAADMKANGSGLLVGIDAPLGDHLRGGVTAGAGETSMDVAARHSDANSRNNHVGAYLGGTWGGWHVDGGVAGSWHDIDSQRRSQLALPGQVHANYDARTLQAFVEGGYRFEFAHGSVEPYLNVTHVAVRTDEVSEEGSPAALHSDGETTEVNYGTLGVHGLWHLSGEGATRISAYGTLGWRHAFGDRVALAHNRFAGGERFTVAGTPWARDAAVVQAGIDFAISKHTSISAGYSGLIGKDARDHAAKMSLQVTF